MHPLSSRNQRGFSLVSMLMIMGLVLGAVLSVSQSQVFNHKAQLGIKSKQSYSDASQALLQDIIAQFHSDIDDGTSGCLNYNAKFHTRSLQGSAKYAHKKNIPADAEAPQSHKDARLRCRSADQPSNTSNAAENRFYFCVDIKADANAPKDSILNSDGAFAEIVIEMIDLHTQANLSCQQYKARRDDPDDNSVGLALTAGIYWKTKVGQVNTYSQRAITMTANQN